MTRSTRYILTALVLGIATGIFLGERAAMFAFVADIYIRLLQMTVLPYIMVSVIAGLGSLDVQQARTLFLRVGLLTLLLWALALALVFALPLTFPHVESASFFSTSLVEERPPLDFVSLYVPANAFQSLANSVVPAVVLFSGFLGIALIFVENKEPLLSGLLVVDKVLSQANRFAVKLTPIGLFAIAANTIGTVDLTQVGRLQVFLIGYGAMSLLLVFWILPGLVALLTPIPAGRVLQATRDALITAFITGELFIVLPTLVDRAKELLEEYGLPSSDDGAPADVIVPAFYNFPHVAKVLSLSFVLFAAWYSDTALSLATSAQVAVAGIVSMFGSVNTAIPFLLDFARVPADTFQFFLATGIVNSRFGTVAAAMHMVVLALAGTYAMVGKVRVSPVRLARYVVVTIGVTAITLALTGSVLRVIGQSTYDEDKIAMAMQFSRPVSEPAVRLADLPADPIPGGTSVLDAIRQRGRLRVGYIDGAMPYSFVNGRGELVGLDIEMAYQLASELGVGLDFVAIHRDHIADVVNSGRCDVVMSGVALTPLRASTMTFSTPYLDETVAFVTPDYRRSDFSSAERIRSTPNLRVAVPNLPFFEEIVHREFPNLTIVPADMNTGIDDYFANRGEPVDAIAMSAERGSFETLLHPDYSVAIPQPVALKIPLAYGVANRDVEFARFMGLWVEIKKRDGTIPALYDHWVLGKDARPPRPRWSVIRNILHWVD